MTFFRRLLSSCWYRHAPYPLIVVRGTHTSWECRSCLADLGDVLPDQVLKVKKKNNDHGGTSLTAGAPVSVLGYKSAAARRKVS